MSQVLQSRSNDVLEPPTSSNTYAFDLLRNEENTKLPIIPDKDVVGSESEIMGLLGREKKFVRLEDRVEELYSSLLILIDYQVEKAGQSGSRIKTHARRRLGMGF